MPSFKCQYLDKWLHKGQISQEEYDKAIKKLDGHDKQIREDAIESIKAILEEGYTMMWGERKTLEKIREWLKGAENGRY